MKAVEDAVPAKKKPFYFYCLMFIYFKVKGRLRDEMPVPCHRKRGNEQEESEKKRRKIETPICQEANSLKGRTALSKMSNEPLAKALFLSPSSRSSRIKKKMKKKKKRIL